MADAGSQANSSKTLPEDAQTRVRGAAQRGESRWKRPKRDTRRHAGHIRQALAALRRSLRLRFKTLPHDLADALPGLVLLAKTVMDEPHQRPQTQIREKRQIRELEGGGFASIIRGFIVTSRSSTALLMQNSSIRKSPNASKTDWGSGMCGISLGIDASDSPSPAWKGPVNK